MIQLFQDSYGARYTNQASRMWQYGWASPSRRFQVIQCLCNIGKHPTSQLFIREYLNLRSSVCWPSLKLGWKPRHWKSQLLVSIPTSQVIKQPNVRTKFLHVLLSYDVVPRVHQLLLIGHETRTLVRMKKERTEATMNPCQTVAYLRTYLPHGAESFLRS